MKNAIKNEVIEILPRTCLTSSAAKYLGIPEKTLKKSRSTGTLYGVATPSYKKVKNTVFYEYKTLNEWLDSLPSFCNATDEKLQSF